MTIRRMTNTEQVNDRKARARVGTSGIISSLRRRERRECRVAFCWRWSREASGGGEDGGTRKRVEKLVERDEPRKNRDGERAWLFELASSTWNKLPVNNFWTHTHTNCGHTNYVAYISSLRVSMCPRIPSSVKNEAEHEAGTGGRVSLRGLIGFGSNPRVRPAHRKRTDYTFNSIYHTTEQKARISKQVHQSFSYPNRSAWSEAERASYKIGRAHV